MAKEIQLRRGTSARWAEVNPILAEGEQGYETDTKLSKIGDGITAWNDLPYAYKTINGEPIAGEGNIETVGKKYINEDGITGGEIFNSNNNIASGENSHAEGDSSYGKDLTTKFNESSDYIRDSDYSFHYHITSLSNMEGDTAPVIETGSLISFIIANGTHRTVIFTVKNAYMDANFFDHVEVEPQENEILPTAEEINAVLMVRNKGARGTNSHIEGYNCMATGDNSHAQGYETDTYGDCSTTMGFSTIASNYGQTALGYLNTIEEQSSAKVFDKTKTLFSIGNGELGVCNGSAEGQPANRSDALKMLGDGTTWISGIGTFTGKNAEANNSLQAVVNGKLDAKLAVGEKYKNGGEIFNSDSNIASGEGSHAEGYYTSALGDYGSHAEGRETTAYGWDSHAEGRSTTAYGLDSHAEGYSLEDASKLKYGVNNKNLEDATIEEIIDKWETNKFSLAFGNGSHVEGSTNIAAMYSHAEGVITKALGSPSHAEGFCTDAQNFAQHSQGCYNTLEEQPSATPDITKTIFSVGNGTSETTRSDALKMLGSGETWIAGAVHNPQADYAEMFEWQDGNINDEDRVGYFVTMKEDKIVKATSKDNYILGIVSAAPAIIGDNPNLWHGQYINDEWGRPIYENIEVKYTDYETNEQGERVEVEKTRIDHVRKLNPEWDTTKPYVDRTERKEWDAVGLMGKLLVRQDGTLTAGGFCKPDDNGIATASTEGYYVMKVNNDRQALVMFR